MPGKKKTEETISKTTASPEETPRPAEEAPEPSAELTQVKKRRKAGEDATEAAPIRKKAVLLPSDSASAPEPPAKADKPKKTAKAKTPAPAAAPEPEPASPTEPVEAKAARRKKVELPAVQAAPAPEPDKAASAPSEKPRRLFGGAQSKPAPKAAAPAPAPVSPAPKEAPVAASSAPAAAPVKAAEPPAPANASAAAESKPRRLFGRPEAAAPKAAPKPAEAASVPERPAVVQAPPVQPAPAQAAPAPASVPPSTDRPKRLFGRKAEPEAPAPAVQPAAPATALPESVQAEAPASSNEPAPLTAVFRTREGSRPAARQAAPAPEAKPPVQPAPEAPSAPQEEIRSEAAEVTDAMDAGAAVGFSLRAKGSILNRPAPSEEPDEDKDGEGGALAATWRSSEDDDQADAKGGRSRRRRRRRSRADDAGGQDDELDAAGGPAEDEFEDDRDAPAAVSAAPAEGRASKAEPAAQTFSKKADAKPAPKPRIPVAVDSPQVVLRDGVTLLARNRQVIPPLVFFGSPDSSGSRAQLLEQAREASEQGVHLYSLPIELEGSVDEPDAALHAARSLMADIAEVDSEAMFLLRLNLTPPDDWYQRWPGSRWRPKNSEFPEPSIADDGFWEMLKATAAAFVASCGSGPHGGRLIGVHLERGGWHSMDDSGYDTSEAARGKFSRWLKQRYRDDVVSLRASWFDGRVSFENVQVPDYAHRHGKDTDFVRLDRRARRWVDYHLFLSDLIVERIADLAYAAKAASSARLMVGVSYGSTFEWSHPGSGHLSLGKLLRCAEIDFIAGPPSYRGRQPGESAAFPWPIDSLVLNGKLALSEEDYRTPIGRSDEDAAQPLMRTPQALEAAHWRGAGAVLAHGGGVMWMDSTGRGWLNSRGIWERGAKVKQALAWRTAAPMQDPDVALFIDERSLAYLSDERAFGILVQNVRESVLRSGMSVGFYLLSDLAHRESFPEARLYVFVNAWDIRPEVRSAIKTRLQRDNKVLFWLYCAGLFEGGRESLERAREVTGIALRPQPFNSKPGTTLVNLRDPLCRVLPEELMAQGGTLEPSYFAIPEDATVLGEYTQTGLASFVVRKFPSPGTSDEPWTSVFLGEPVVTPGFFRALGQMAGAHVYSLDDDVAHVRPPFLTLHCSGAGVRTITLPDKWSCFDLIQRVWMPVENSSLKFLGLDGATYSFLVGHRSEIEAILSSSDAGALSEEEILAHQDNTVKWESIQFDVPVMKLDEWVEESWSEELADDLLLKPSLIEDVESGEDGDGEPDESPRSSGKRRRGRRKGREKRSDPGQQAQEKAQTVNFLFRKRE